MTAQPGISISQERIEELLLSTEREGIEGLIEWLRRSDFYYAPASTQYHGCYDGGLVEHVLNVYAALRFHYESLMETGEFNIPEISEASLILVALLHDVCKINTYEPTFRNVKNDQTGQWERVDTYKRNPKLPMGHAGKSVFIVQQFIKLTTDEALAIYWHMGGFDLSTYNSANELSQAWNNSLLGYMLHQADMTATYIMENEKYVLTEA